MKKILITFLLAISCACTAAGISACGLFADLEYELSDDGTYYIVSWCKDSVTEIEIPSTYKNLPVTTIGAGAFDFTRSLTSITIPNSITTIEHEAFDYCISLTNITLPDSLTYIGHSAFYDCTALTSITIPEGVTYIGDKVFYNCTSLTNISIPDSVTFIGDRAFKNCDSLEYYTSAYCKYLGNETNNYVVLVEAHTAFSNLTINDNTKIIYCNACKEFTDIKQLSLPDGITCIGDYAFYKCTALERIGLPENLIYIGQSAFSGCTALYNISIPDGVTYIGDSAFSGCNAVEKISVPDSLIYIGNSAFACANLKYYEYENGYYLGNSSNNYVVLVGVIDTSITSFTINSDTKHVDTYAFYECSALTSITIPDSVISIGLGAFNRCSSLTSVTIGSGVTYIGQDIFSRCTSLTSITFKDTSGLFFIDSDGDKFNTDIDLTDASQNVTYLTDTYKYSQLCKNDTYRYLYCSRDTI